MAFDVSRNISSCKNRKTLDVKKKILYTEAQVLLYYPIMIWFTTKCAMKYSISCLTYICRKIPQCFCGKLNMPTLYNFKIQGNTHCTWYSQRNKKTTRCIIYSASAFREWNSTKQQHSIQYKPMSIDEFGSYKEQIFKYLLKPRYQ